MFSEIAWGSFLTLKGPFPYEVRSARGVLKGMLRKVVVGPTGVTFFPESVLCRSGQEWIPGNANVTWTTLWGSLPEHHPVAGEMSFKVPGADLFLFVEEKAAVPATA